MWETEFCFLLVLICSDMHVLSLLFGFRALLRASEQGRLRDTPGLPPHPPWRATPAPPQTPPAPVRRWLNWLRWARTAQTRQVDLHTSPRYICNVYLYIVNVKPNYLSHGQLYYMYLHVYSHLLIFIHLYHLWWIPMILKSIGIRHCVQATSFPL